MERPNPCLTCGACCAYYRASFYWAEADDETPGGVPVSLTRKLNEHRRVMIGSEGSKPRCIALEGTIGEQVYCTIYERRSSVCREFEASWSNGKRNERCDAARIAWGLPPLEPDAWDFPDIPKAA
ncbi:MAG: YkgJ family cysteine cluster protein [Desulfomonilia bacterium]|nr:YkgJ family cysteine cluster protein [Pseudomonadota bacterium]HON38826.1 YkgJ family cysteine cluster protein [Deltaproteobacteria bacterium]HRS56778.1 YkgJ family cysteine cluster protein [Desulfomonilia bacterium]HPD21784.1 YkgJ family cysteine cluster protein [Deltaproteobacteria bacterium]HPX18688.1 YkgJ family cysteine cluster protein [Deltaproteobacteria bacterium]